MERPDEKVLNALMQLKGDSRFQCVLGWFKGSLKKADQKNRVLIKEALHQSQGEAQTLAEITEYAENAEKFIKT